MNKKNGTTVGFIAAAIALLVAAMAVPAGAGDLNRLLTGDYAANSSFVCAVAYGGFDPDLNRLLPDPPGLISGTNSGSSQGVASFDGNGGSTFRGKVLSVTHDPAGSTAPVSQFDMVCSGTTQVNQDLSTEIEYDCKIYPLAGPFPNPPYPPEFYMEIKGLRAKGQLLGTMDNILFQRADTEPNVETIYFVNFLPYPYDYIKVLERICTGSGTYMKITGQSKKWNMVTRAEYRYKETDVVYRLTWQGR